MRALTILKTALLLLPSLAEANLLWSYSYSGAGVAGSGYLTTSAVPDATGAYAIQALTGVENGAAIRMLFPAGVFSVSGGGEFTSDNLLRAGSPQLDFGGFTFATSADQHNVYYTGGSYHDLAGADCPAATCGDPSHLGTVVNFAATVVPSIDWNFSYSGVGITGSGILTTLATPNAAGAYTIAGLTGNQNGVAMNALLPAGVYNVSGGGDFSSDNLLFPSDPFLDFGGFTFESGADLYNIYRSGDTYRDLVDTDCPAATCGDPNHLGTIITFAVSRAVPEPATWMLIALVLFGWTAAELRSRRRTSIVSTPPEAGRLVNR
jgi:hypothetical protein